MLGSPRLDVRYYLVLVSMLGCWLILGDGLLCLKVWLYRRQKVLEPGVTQDSWRILLLHLSAVHFSLRRVLLGPGVRQVAWLVTH